jgi:tetratricopeptide (TPR) repeat protein
MPSPSPTLIPTATSLPFSPATQEETLILIATFYHTEGVADTDVHGEIHRAIQKVASDLDLRRLRIEIEPTRLRADDQDEANKLGQRYQASMIIWGEDTGVRLTVNYLNLVESASFATEVQISETERAQLANPSAYASFVTSDLPGQLTFLSFFAIGQSFVSQKAYPDAVQAIERAIASRSPESKPEGLADAYFGLGWLYQIPLEDNEQAIDAYTKAIVLNG